MSIIKNSSIFLLILCVSSTSFCQDDDSKVRVARNNNNKKKNAKPHPLDAALELAHNGLKRLEKIQDYKAVLVRRERTNGKLSNFEYSNVKIRNAQPEKNIPFSVYMKFTKPRSINGREVIWVDGQNDGKIIAHEAGMILGKITVYLKPTGPIAMKGNRYPIYEAGFKVLAERLIEKAARERQYGECDVKIIEGKTVSKRPCKLIEVIHPIKRDHFDFHIARIYIDEEMGLPVRYEAYTWPESKNEKPVLLEQYLWTQIELNVGLTDEDFNPRSKEYNYCIADLPNSKKSAKPVNVANRK